MRHSFQNHLKHSDITPKSLYMNRRSLMQGLGAGLASAALLPSPGQTQPRLGDYPTSVHSTNETPNSFEEITSYNNYYEFGTGKTDPKENAGQLTTDPWSITVDGLVDNPGTYDLADVLKGASLEERIYRLRCVEAWSMVVPWIGFELNQFLAKVGVQSGAKFVAFETLERPSEMPGLRQPVLNWPYREGLRLDEALHPLTILATGLYGEDMPNQNGAPIRLVVPWKYGFKSIKSIVRITLTDTQPPTAWNMSQPSEYGFYSNVNPNVDHPRWSQATERPIGGGLFSRRKPTLMFNGYEEEVAHLYKDMDLRKFY
jgi:sulfoxide reductase catalytic subunit YedY